MSVFKRPRHRSRMTRLPEEPLPAVGPQASRAAHQLFKVLDLRQKNQILAVAHFPQQESDELKLDELEFVNKFSSVLFVHRLLHKTPPTIVDCCVVDDIPGVKTS